MNTITIRTHIILPKDLMVKLDKKAGKRSKSKFIEEALREKFEREERTRVLHESAGILKDYDFPDWSTPEKTSTWVRKLRKESDKRLLRKWGGKLKK